MNYYGRFRHSALYPLLARINHHVQKWIRAKYRRLRAYRAMKRAWDRITTQTPGAAAPLALGNRGLVLASAGESKKSPVTGDCHAGICGSPGVKFPRATRPQTWLAPLVFE